MEIRPLATDAEAERCAAMMSATDPWLRYGRKYDACLKALLDQTSEIFVAVDGEVIGFIAIVMRGALVGYIRMICIDADTRGKGLGSQLVAFAEERIFRETPNVFLFVSEFNTRARALYERLGYEKVAEMRDYIARGISEILMRKTRGPLAEFSKP
jgi:ribosomal protein S18 acetylase RimI-like enzyme